MCPFELDHLKRKDNCTFRRKFFLVGKEKERNTKNDGIIRINDEQQHK